MKRLIKAFIVSLLIITFGIMYMVIDNNNYNNKLKKKIISNTDIKNVNYINKYNDYYIVKDNNYLYLFNNKYDELLKIDKILLCENNKNYDIIYNDEKLMYISDYYKGQTLVYEYYDIYTYELIKRVFVGGEYHE